MTNLPVPIPASEVPGNFLTSALWNANVYNLGTYLLNRPLFIGVQGTAQSIPNATWTSLTWDTTVVDTYGGHSAVTNTSRYTAQVAGYYTVAGASAYAVSSSGYRAASIAVNGTIKKGCVSWWVTSDPGDTISIPTPVQPIFLNVNDYVEIKTAQNCGSALNTDPASDLSPSMSVWWCHA